MITATASETEFLPIVSFSSEEPKFQTFTFQYEWTWGDGTVTVQSIDINALRIEGAEVQFAYKVVRPRDVQSERIIGITRAPLS